MFGRRASPQFLLASALVVVTGCALGQRPSFIETPTVVGTMTGDAAIDEVLGKLDQVRTATFTATFDGLLAFGGVASSSTVSQNGSTEQVHRSTTIGDVRYVSDLGMSKTCSVASQTCVDGIDAARVSDTGVTPDFVFGDIAKRMRRDATAKIGPAVASVVDIAGQTAACVDLPVSGGTKLYCALDNGVLAKYVGGDITITLTSYLPVADETTFTP